MMNRREYKILHTPHVVAGNPSNLAWGERQLGLDSRLIYFSKSKFDFSRPEDIFFGENSPLFLLLIYKFLVLFYALFTKDIIHYNNGSTLFDPPKNIGQRDSGPKRLLKKIYNCTLGQLHLLDLKLFKFFGKRLFITFQGSDARLYQYHIEHFSISHYHVLKDPSQELLKDKQKIHFINSISPYMTAMFAVNPDLLHTLPMNASFLPYSNVNIQDWRPRQPHRKIRHIIHAPSNTEVKGTKIIEAAINRLISEGHNIQYTRIHGKKHDEMKQLLEEADIIVDQLLVGWYGGLAVEAMALGLPVVCYLREEDLSFLPTEMKLDCPVIKADPDNIYEVLKHTISIKEESYLALQLKSRAYVEKWHDPIKIARHLQLLYEAGK